MRKNDCASSAYRENTLLSILVFRFFFYVFQWERNEKKKKIQKIVTTLTQESLGHLLKNDSRYMNIDNISPLLCKL